MGITYLDNILTITGIEGIDQNLFNNEVQYKFGNFFKFATVNPY